MIRFEPWLVGTKQALLASFFSQLIGVIRDCGTDPHIAEKLASNPTIIDQILARMSRYAAHLEKGSLVLDYAGAFDPTGKTKAAAAGVKILSALANWIAPKDRSLEKLKEQITHDLRTLSKLVSGLRFTVAIDDLDRLDPEESVEILRLVKAVANFPIVTYLVCYDREVLAEHVKTVLKIKDGHKYIEKIFQTFLPLPPQEPFALRRFVRKLLLEAFPDALQSDSTTDKERLQREQIFFDIWVGRFVETPRDAIRLCEAIKFGWPFIQTKADFIDFAWLQLVKLQCHSLHTWVRNYVVNIGSYRDGGRPGDDEPSTEAQNLLKIFQDIGWRIDRDRYGIDEFLPGLKYYTDNEKPRVFDVEKGELERLENDRRLGSPSHWRYYFSFDAPSYAMDDDILARFTRAVVTSPQEALSVLHQVILRPHATQPGHYYFEVFLERLFDQRVSLKPDQLIGLATILSQVMDDVGQPPGINFGRQIAWNRAITLLASPVSPHLAKLVKDAPAINWLADVIRDQAFVLGVPDQSTARSERQWISREHFDASLKALLLRFNEMGIAGIIKKPVPLAMLYCWQQLGDKNELSAAINAEISSDFGLLQFLDALKTWIATSNKGVYQHIRPEVVGHFLDYAVVRERLKKFSDDPYPPLKEKVSGILKMIEDREA